MALKEPWRGNPAEKQYQFLTDFSGGINSRIEDSLLKDNVARNITNFDIIAGGLLSKRKGFTPVMATQIREYLKQYFAITSTDESTINSSIDRKIENSWTFYTGDSVVISLKVNDGIINVIMSKDEFGKDTISFTNRKFNAKNTIIENYGNRQVLVYFDSSTNTSKPFLLSWREDNWVDFNSSLESAFDVTPTHKIIDKEFDSLAKLQGIVYSTQVPNVYSIPMIDISYNKTMNYYYFATKNISLSGRQYVYGGALNTDAASEFKIDEFNFVKSIIEKIATSMGFKIDDVDEMYISYYQQSVATSEITVNQKKYKIDLKELLKKGIFENLRFKNTKLFIDISYAPIYDFRERRLVTQPEFSKYLSVYEAVKEQSRQMQDSALGAISIIPDFNIIKDIKKKYGDDFRSNAEFVDFPQMWEYNLSLTWPMPSHFEIENSREGVGAWGGQETIYQYSGYVRSYTSQATAMFDVNKLLTTKQYEVSPNKKRYELNKDTFKLSIPIKSRNPKQINQLFKNIEVTKDDFSVANNSITIDEAIEKITFEGCKVVIGNLQTVPRIAGLTNNNPIYSIYNDKKVWFVVSIGYDRDATDSDIVSGSAYHIDFTGKKVFQPLFIKYVGIDTVELWKNGFSSLPAEGSHPTEKIRKETINSYRPYGFIDDKDVTYHSLDTPWPNQNNHYSFYSVFWKGIPDSATGNYQGNLVRSIDDMSITLDYIDNVLHNAHSSLSGEAISKFVPDAYTFKQLSYNLLSLTENVDIGAFEIPDFADSTKVDEFKKNISQYVQVDGQAPIPTLSSLIQINGYYPEVNRPAVFKASLELPGKTEADRKTQYEDYKFGWLFMPVEKWASLQAQVTSTQQYVSDIVAPAFANTLAGVGYEHSFATIMPQTANPSIILCFAIHKDKEPKAITNLDDVLQVQLNINPVKAYGEVFTPAESMRDFMLVDKSIVWKNQMFLYGGSNSFFVSDINNFGYFPMSYNTQIPSDSPIRSMTIYYDSLIVATDRQQFVITGNSPDDKTNPFTINELNDDIGVAAPKTVRNNANYIFQLTADGVYLVKSLFNFRDRYNTEKVDDAIAGDIISDPNACAVVWNNKYYLCIPSKKQLWIYYNDFKAWIKYESEIFDLNNMFVINDELVLVSNKVGQIYKFSKEEENVHGEGPYQDIQFFDKTTTELKDNADGTKSLSPVEIRYPIESTYKSKEIDFGLPNHDKKLKKLQVRFAETPGSNQLFVKVWIDGTLKVSPDKDVITTNADGTVTKSTTTTPEITTTANSNWVGTAAGEFKSGDVTYTGNRNNVGNKHDQDTDQLHEVIVAGRGRNMQFEIVHRQNKRLNVKNFATLLKVKKPKALRTYSQKG